MGVLIFIGESILIYDMIRVLFYIEGKYFADEGERNTTEENRAFFKIDGKYRQMSCGGVQRCYNQNK